MTRITGLLIVVSALLLAIGGAAGYLMPSPCRATPEATPRHYVIQPLTASVALGSIRFIAPI